MKHTNTLRASVLAAVAAGAMALAMSPALAATAVTGTTAPVVEAWAPTWPTTTTELLNGGVTGSGGLDTTAWFQYGTTTAYGSTTANQDAGTGTAQVGISDDAINLLPGTTYHFRMDAKNSVGTTNGKDGTFKTTAAPVVTTSKPAVEAWAASWPSDNGALLNGGVTPNGLATTAHFQYGPTTAYGSVTADQSIPAGTAQVGISDNAVGLQSGTVYHFRTVAVNSKGTTNGADGTFTTTGTTPPVYTLPAGGTKIGTNGTNGWVVFTFDDGPYTGTPYLLKELAALGLHAYFFDVGQQIQAFPSYMQAEVAAGDVIGNHTYDHQSLTEATPPLTSAQITAEFTQDNQIITSLGAPAPTLWRAPYGETSPAVNAIADGLGMTGVYSYGNGVVDSGDWVTDANGNPDASAATITANVESGMALYGNGTKLGIDLEFHDGNNIQQTINALPAIVKYLNAHDITASMTLPSFTKYN